MMEHIPTTFMRQRTKFVTVQKTAAGRPQQYRIRTGSSQLFARRLYESRAEEDHCLPLAEDKI